MAPKFFSKLFKRQQEVYSHPRIIGISEDTCNINGDPFNREKLPIPPPGQRQLTLGTRQCNPQHQSRFFQLPEEIRKMIYIELMGNRRVHIDYAWKQPSPWRQQALKGGRRWGWYHYICQREGGLFISEAWRLPRCWNWDDEREAWKEGLKSPPPGTKLGGVEWLRCCQLGYEEALIVLYGTNTFVPECLATPFHMHRLLPRCSTSLITSMDITTEPWHSSKAWPKVYPLLLDLLQHTFHNVRQLRLTIHMPAWDLVGKDVDDEKLEEIFAPWEQLVSSRDWSRLELCAPYDWQDCLKKMAENQNKWNLTMTEWFARYNLPESF